MKIDKQSSCFFGCGSVAVLFVLFVWMNIQFSIKSAGELDVAENKIKLLKYDPTPIIVKVEEVIPFQDRVFEKDNYRRVDFGGIYSKSQSFSDFQKLDQEKAMSIFDYKQDGRFVVFRFSLKIIDDGVLYYSTLEKKSDPLPEAARFVGVEYLGNGEFKINHELDDDVSSILLTLLIWGVNICWTAVLAFTIFQADKELLKKDLEIQKQKEISKDNSY